ncbi:Lipoxygenase [Rhizoclosmatium globosum]|uniref:Manganese lipoxygenase n=1 Tax=Rhizoclosmatium globosum TaxID=329046 RepID=A0A1Y2B9R2_9FUNG|nr:Lipoxygenase [Rhizoclosmatium globosum]|eukprot:ORY31563.1 Lipoxygenase [Rhizoclosmatium globosum]
MTTFFHPSASAFSGDKLIIEITTGPDNHGLVDLSLELTLFHTETRDPSAKVFESATSKASVLAYNPIFTKSTNSTKNVFHVTASDKIHDNVHAIALNNSNTKEWLFETIVIKRERDGEFSKGWYFPIYSWIVAGPRRLFFYGASLPHDKNLPPKIRELREEDVKYWQKRYVPTFKMEGLPIGLTAVTAELVSDEKFSDLKQGDFEYHAKKGLAARGIVNLLTLGRELFTSFANVEQLLYIMEKKPAIADTWRNDHVFAAQVLSGVNPVQIRAVTRDAAFPFKFLPAATKEALAKVPYLAGKDIAQEIKAGHFSYVDFTTFLGPFVEKINSDCAALGEDESKHKYDGYMAAPTALFWHDTASGQILPVAIRVVPEGDTFYPPAEDEINDSVLNQWLLAKMWFGLGDTNVHQLSTHLLRTTSTMAINAAARERLIYTIMKIFSIGEAAFDFIKHAYTQWDFYSSSPVKDLEKRGFSGKVEGGSSLETPGQYPWAEDARDLYSVIQKYVGDYINVYYESDASVAADPELQNWIKEAAEFNGGTRAVLQEVVSILIWTTTARKPASFALLIHSHRPRKKSRKVLMESLPSIAEAARVSGIVATLSSYEPDEVFIGQRGYDLHGPSQEKEEKAFEAFGESLKAYKKRVEERNKTLKGRIENPYLWLSPDKITNSIAI